jgi:hypothetical protein
MTRAYPQRLARVAAVLLGLLVAGMSLGAQEPVVLAVGSAQQTGPREFILSVTFHNLGGKLAADYTAFIHFDRLPSAETLIVQAAPGLRPLVAPTAASAWGPNETTTVSFAPVTLSAGEKRDIYVRAGLYDAGADGRRLPLSGQDASGRVPIGRLTPQGEGYVFVRTPLALAGSAAERVGVRPRALVKTPPGSPLVGFGDADLAAWRVEDLAGGTARLERTREQLCWSEAALRVTYSGSGPASGFVLRPATACALPDDASAVFLWVFGNAVGWSEVPSLEAPLLSVFVELLDGQGATRRLAFPGLVNCPFWYVHRVAVPASWPRPLQCVGIGFSGCSNRSPAWLMLDLLSVARGDSLQPLETTVRLDDPPFPTTPDGPLPELPAGGQQDRVEAIPEGFRLSSEGTDGRLVYEYRPMSGGLDDVEALWFGPGASTAAQRVRLAAGSGPLAEAKGRSLGPGAAPGARTCLEAQLVDGRVVTHWRWRTPTGDRSYALVLSLHGKSLVVDLQGDDGGLSGFCAGQLRGQLGARFVPFPYWSYGLRDWGRDGGVVVVGELFLSGFPDWYRSAATTPTFDLPLSHEPEALLGGGITYCPGVEYQPRSDGTRTPLRERFVFTLSPDVRDVLPTLPHPPSPNAAKLAAYAHATGGQASRLPDQLDAWRRLHAYGVDKVYIRHFDGMWSDLPQGTQEWTLTEHAAPVVGDVAVRTYLDALSALGFLPVLYTNYTDLQPVAAEFDWDRVMRLPGGDVSPWCWPGSYPLKPIRAVELEEQYAPRIKARFGTQGSFCDVHTSVAPWHKVDHDSRLPGAGQFGTTYRCYAKLLLNERKVYGAVYSEGSRHWLYAGLHDGSDAQLCAPRPHLEPFLVDFDLLRIHPLEMDAGMSWIERYVKDSFAGPKAGGPQQAAALALGGWEAALDRFNAATLAFGHQATFTRLSFHGYESDIKTYYLIQPVQSLYAMRRALEIRYHEPGEPGRLLGVSDAIRTNVYRHSQVTVRYETGLEVWVNGSLTEAWRVETAAGAYSLPPSGFVCVAPDQVLSYSVSCGPGRVDYCRTPASRFTDTRGQFQRLGEFETDGAALLRATGDAVWSIYPLGNASVLRVNATSLSLQAPLALVALGEQGDVLARFESNAEDGWLTVPLDLGAFRFELSARR